MSTPTPAPNKFWLPLSYLVRALLLANVVAAVAAVLTDMRAKNAAAGWIDDPSTINLASARDIDSSMQLSANIQLVVFLVTVVPFIAWLYQAHVSPWMARRWMEYKSGWAIGAWFVPFLNLARPPKIVTDVRRGALDRADFQNALIGWWWGSFLVGSIATRIGTGIARGNPDDTGMKILEEVRDSSSVYVFADTVTAIAAVLAIIVVAVVTREVLDRHEAVASGRVRIDDYRPAPVAPPPRPPGPVA